MLTCVCPYASMSRIEHDVKNNNLFQIICSIQISLCTSVGERSLKGLATAACDILCTAKESTEIVLVMIRHHLSRELR